MSHLRAACQLSIIFDSCRTASLSGACHEDVAASTSRRHAGLPHNAVLFTQESLAIAKMTAWCAHI